MRSVHAAIFCLLAALALSGCMRVVVPLGTALSPGDTVLVGERWL
jgi:hypothetical protein